MGDLLVGLGIALVAEGLLWALAPDLARRGLEQIAAAPPGQVRALAWTVVACGLALVWLVRG
jgi:hypothetical protein